MYSGYVEHSVAYRFCVLQSDVFDCNTIIDSLFDKISHALIKINNEIISNEELKRSKKPRKLYICFGDEFQNFFLDNEPSTFF